MCFASSFRWIYYCHSSKSTEKETGKTHLCALCGFLSGSPTSCSMQQMNENLADFSQKTTWYNILFLVRVFSLFRLMKSKNLSKHCRILCTKQFFCHKQMVIAEKVFVLKFSNFMSKNCKKSKICEWFESTLNLLVYFDLIQPNSLFSNLTRPAVFAGGCWVLGAVEFCFS